MSKLEKFIGRAGLGLGFFLAACGAARAQSVWIDMKPILSVFEEAMAEAGRKKK